MALRDTKTPKVHFHLKASCLGLIRNEADFCGPLATEEVRSSIQGILSLYNQPNLENLSYQRGASRPIAIEAFANKPLLAEPTPAALQKPCAGTLPNVLLTVLTYGFSPVTCLLFAAHGQGGSELSLATAKRHRRSIENHVSGLGGAIQIGSTVTYMLKLQVLS